MSNGDEEPTDAPDEAAADDGAEQPDAGPTAEDPDEASEDLPVADEEDEDAGPGLEESIADARAAIEGEDVDGEALGEALDAVEAATVAAETEADLDDVEAVLDEVADAVESADLPEPDEADEDAEDPRAALESRVEERRAAVEEARGPYAEDVVEGVEAVKSTIADTRWTETGEAEAAEAVGTFLDGANDALDSDLATDGDAPNELADALDDATAAVDDAGLDPDDDAATLAALVEAAAAFGEAVDAAEAWEDLTTREQLEAEGFYDVLGHTKDYPPEWSALKEHEKRGDAAMVLLALEKLGSEFMEEHCLDALRRMGPAEAFDPMIERAERRDKPAIEILGKIADEAAVDSIVEYVETDSDPQLQKTTIKALGEIGSEAATQAVANKLVTENGGVRSHAARALGMIGDPRAVEPLADVLADDGVDTVRASAAWALVQIGTAGALEAAAEYADDRSALVAAEAETAVEALGAATA